MNQLTISIKQNLVPTSKFNIKTPHTMIPRFITIHNTANDASANNEIAFMIRNDNDTSFHFAVDDVEIIQGLPLNRNGWHAGDGINGVGNRQSIGVEICYSKSGGERFVKAEENAAWLVANLMKDHNIPLEHIRTHQSWNGKYCPHRTLNLGWQRFLNMIQLEINRLGGTTSNNNTNTTNNINSIVDWMKSQGMNSSFTNRAKLAEQYGIGNYQGTAEQNTQLLNNLRNQNNNSNISSKPIQQFYPSTSTGGSSIVNALDDIGVDSSFTNRTQIALANGIDNYTGTVNQNTKMLKLLREGRLVLP